MNKEILDKLDQIYDLIESSLPAPEDVPIHSHTVLIGEKYSHKPRKSRWKFL